MVFVLVDGMLGENTGKIVISRSTWDKWYAWHPVRLGAFGTGKVVFMEHVARNRCMGVTIYQPLDIVNPDLLENSEVSG